MFIFPEMRTIYKADKPCTSNYSNLKNKYCCKTSFQVSELCYFNFILVLTLNKFHKTLNVILHK